MSQLRGVYITNRSGKRLAGMIAAQEMEKTPRKPAEMFEFFIQGEFTQLNDYIRVERGNKFGAADIKEAETLRAKRACDGLPKAARYPVEIEFIWHREDRRTDPDNIAFAAKFVLDGMVKAGVLKDDGMDEIVGIIHRYALDKKNPGVTVFIRCVGA